MAKENGNLWIQYAYRMHSVGIMISSGEKRFRLNNPFSLLQKYSDKINWGFQKKRLLTYQGDDHNQ